VLCFSGCVTFHRCRRSFVVRCSLFVVRCSLFVVRCSLFVVRCSLFVVRCSLFVLRPSSFVLRCSLFVFRRSLRRRCCWLPVFVVASSILFAAVSVVGCCVHRALRWKLQCATSAVLCATLALKRPFAASLRGLRVSDVDRRCC